MNNKFIISLLFSFFTSVSVADELVNLSARQLVNMQKNTNALVIDIRTEKEWGTTGTIPGSHKLQFFSSKGKYNTEKWLSDLKQLKSTDDQAVVLVCRSGNRSGRVGNLLTKQLNLKNIYHLSNGIKSWVKGGHLTSKHCPDQLACK